MAGTVVGSKAGAGGKLGAEAAVAKRDQLKSQQLRSCILVLGTPESGSQLLAGVMNRLGCTAPASASVDVRGAAATSGSIKVREICDEVLASAGSSWDDLNPFPSEWLQSPVARGFIKRAVQTLREDFGDSPLFVLEDPRICRLVPFWAEALKRIECAARPILMVRNPLETAEALQAETASSEALGQMLWLRYALDAEHATRGMPRFHASFDQLIQGWDGVAARAEESLELIWPKAIPNAEVEITEFLAGAEASRQGVQARSLTSALLPEWLREAYKVMNGWAVGEEMGAHRPILDRIRSEFDAASYAFGRVVRAERASKSRDERAEQREAERTILEAEILRLGAENVATASELEGVRAALQEQRRRTTLTEAQLHELTEGREELEAKLHDARAEVAATRERRKEMARVITRRDAEIQKRYEELAVLERRLLRFSISWQAKRLFSRLKRLFRGRRKAPPADNHNVGPRD